VSKGSPPLCLGFVALGVLCSLSPGCATFREPTVAAQDGRVGLVSMDGINLKVDLLVTNPNTWGVTVESVDYELLMGGSRLLKGKAQIQTQVVGRSNREVALPVSISFARLLATPEAVSSPTGEVEYSLSGKVAVGGVVPLVSQHLPFSYSGTLHMRELLQDPILLLSSPDAQAVAQRVFGSIIGR
jgi:LEA14-like dessication related protein